MSGEEEIMEVTEDTELSELSEAVRQAQRELAEERRKNQAAEEKLEMIKTMTMLACQELHMADWKMAKADLILEYQRAKQREILEKMEGARKVMEQARTTEGFKKILQDLIEIEKEKVREVEEKDKLIAEKMKKINAYMESLPEDKREKFRKEKMASIEEGLQTIKDSEEEWKRIKAHAETVSIEHLFEDKK